MRRRPPSLSKSTSGGVVAAYKHHLNAANHKRFGGVLAAYKRSKGLGDCGCEGGGLSGAWDDLVTQGKALIAPAQKKADDFELAIKAILVFSCIAAVTGILTNVRKR